MAQRTPEPWRARARHACPKGPNSGMARLLRACRRRIGNAVGDDRGMVAILAAFSLPVLVLMAGGASDYARSLNARTRLQTALDSALLATAGHRMTYPDTNADDLRKYFRERLKGEYERRLKNRKLTLNLNETVFKVEDDKLVAEASGSFKTAFLPFIGISTLTVKVQAATQTGFSRLEVALVLDVSSSMTAYGATGKRKIDELKEAAARFVDVMHERFAGAPAEKVRIAIVPFSQYVNVGKGFENAQWLRMVPEDEAARARLAEEGIHWEGCVGSREYPWNFNDSSYELRPVPAIMNYPRKAGTTGENPEDYHRRWTNYCPSPILPLTSAITQADTIKKAIENIESSRGTYIPAGLVWGWRVLSHKHPFTQGTPDNDVKAGNVRRVIILMTDGANTRAPGVDELWPPSEHQRRDSDARHTADFYFGKACRKLKHTNRYTGRLWAEVATVAFDIDYDQEEIRRMLRDCATIGMYDVQTGQLTTAFTTIADQISDLYLSQ